MAESLSTIEALNHIALLLTQHLVLLVLVECVLLYAAKVGLVAVSSGPLVKGMVHFAVGEEGRWTERPHVFESILGSVFFLVEDATLFSVFLKTCCGIGLVLLIMGVFL